MKKGDIYIEKIGPTSFPDTGIIQKEGVSIELKKVIEGQTLEFLIHKKRKNRASAKVLRLVEKSELQTKQGCRLDGVCGGCLYQSLPYDKQLAIKDRQMRELLLEANGTTTSFVWEGVLPSPSVEGYRNKMEYSFGDTCKDGPLCLGLHKKASTYDIVQTDTCNIVHEDFNVLLRESLEFFRSRELPHYHKMRHEGFLRHLLIRRSVKKEELLICLVTTTDTQKCEDPRHMPVEEVKALQLSEDLEKAVQDWKEHILLLEQKGVLQAKIAGILHTRNNAYADAVMDYGTRVLYGRNNIRENLLGLDFKLSIFSFFQTNSPGAELLYQKVGNYIGDTRGKSVFDLYSGTGTIAQLLAAYADKVYGVEIVEEAVRAARENAEANGITNCIFLQGDVLKVIDELEEKPDIIVLDPPRDGIHPKALPKIMNFGAEKIVYVACKPSSFARDLQVLKEGGYLLERAAAVDMFPQTPNCELVCLLSSIRRKKKESHITPDAEMEDCLD